MNENASSQFLLISDSSENFQHYDLLQFITSPPSDSILSFKTLTKTRALSNYCFLFCSVLHKITTVYSNVYNSIFTKSLILAQDERWRRG